MLLFFWKMVDAIGSGKFLTNKSLIKIRNSVKEILKPGVKPDFTLSSLDKSPVIVIQNPKELNGIIAPCTKPKKKDAPGIYLVTVDTLAI